MRSRARPTTLSFRGLSSTAQGRRVGEVKADSSRLRSGGPGPGDKTGWGEGTLGEEEGISGRGRGRDARKQALTAPSPHL